MSVNLQQVLIIWIYIPILTRVFIHCGSKFMTSREIFIFIWFKSCRKVATIVFILLISGIWGNSRKRESGNWLVPGIDGHILWDTNGSVAERYCCMKNIITTLASLTLIVLNTLEGTWNIFAFSIFSGHWDDAGTYKLSLKTKIPSLNVLPMLLTQLSRNISVLTPEVVTYYASHCGHYTLPRWEGRPSIIDVALGNVAVRTGKWVSSVKKLDLWKFTY